MVRYRYCRRPCSYTSSSRIPRYILNLLYEIDFHPDYSPRGCAWPGWSFIAIPFACRLPPRNQAKWLFNTTYQRDAPQGSNPFQTNLNMSSPSLSTARQLLDLISASLTTLEKSCSARGVTIPDIQDPFHPASEAFRVGDPAAAEAANVITAAALHLAAIIAPPQNTLYMAAGGVSR